MNRMRLLLTFLLAITLCTASASAAVNREIMPGDPDEPVTVRLTLPEGWIGGITEEIPDGYTFAGTDHPAGQTAPDGRRIHFAVIGEEEIVYTLEGPGTPEIAGTWVDLSSGGEGSPAERAAEAPGFGALAALAGAAATLCIRGVRR